MIAWALPLSRMISICRLDRDETLTAASDLSFVPGNQRAQFKRASRASVIRLNMMIGFSISKSGR